MMEALRDQTRLAISIIFCILLITNATMLGCVYIGSFGFAKSGNSYLAVELILSKKIPQSSTLLSSPSHLKRLQPWTLTKGGVWRRPIMRWKTVSELVPVLVGGHLLIQGIHSRHPP
jgi:hypothetical protein